MKFILTLIAFTLFNFLKSQGNDIREFNFKEYDSLIKKSCPMDCEIKTYHNADFISFKRKDSIINMSYNKDGISRMNKTFGNYHVNYQFYPNLKIKSKNEYLMGISQVGTMEVGVERNYDIEGKIINETDWEKVPYDTGIPGPKINVWKIIKQVKQDFDFDILLDDCFFSIQYYQDDLTKKVNYKIIKFISDNNEKLKLLVYHYDGEFGKFINIENLESELPPGGLVHY
ncbi:hypothetical protein [Chryseobacterium sp. MMS23-Vi53]|uniref:hypothetical protein n=1 Tax=Chryseobacterium sp. MMS23-Vi53 TaxID=3386644 RepID=UPI0039E7B1D5